MPLTTRRLIAGFVAVACAGAIVGGGSVIYSWFHTAPPPIPPRSECRAHVAAGSATLSLEQASNATTIAATARRLGLPDHAVTVGIAAALQESRLHNLNYGDRDSLGLFQQRPSQGWGTAEQIQQPVFAATAFFTHLARIDGWIDLPVNEAAQRVQRSGVPEAYAQWEPKARIIADALTGETPAAFSCRFRNADRFPAAAPLVTALVTELGDAPLDHATTAKAGWLAAQWLVAHAPEHDITAVSFAGHRWTPSTDRWSETGAAGQTAATGSRLHVTLRACASTRTGCR